MASVPVFHLSRLCVAGSKGRRPARNALGWLFAACLCISSSGAWAQPDEAGQRAAEHMEAIKGNVAALQLFLQAMPKGGDLHNHLDGTVYAEEFLRWAAEDGDCVQHDTHKLIDGPCQTPDLPAAGLASEHPAQYAATVDALSMRHFVPTPPDGSGHDHFFNAFAKFMPVGAHHRAGMLAAALGQAAQNHLSYVEYMTDPAAVSSLDTQKLSQRWQADDYAADLAVIQPDIPDLVAAARREFDTADRQLGDQLACDSAQARPACHVAHRYIFYVVRSLPQPVVFAQMALGFALVDADPRFVGINIVAPEDNPTALADYRAHMHMFAFFKQRYPDVPMSLHAGELTLGLAPTRDLRFHIHDAVAAGAQRIGHGVDIAYEDNAHSLLQRMAAQHVAVEINLSSNATILGIEGAEHPLALYRAAGVPVMLSTDDSGVLRSDITREYRRAVTEQHLGYQDLKQMARNSLTYAFVDGSSLWTSAHPDTPVAACRSALAAHTLDDACRTLLGHSDKARLQWQLEQQFHAFEQSAVATGRS